MENNKYLPIGANVAQKYEVIDILGEDDFEILYLVRDLYRKGSFFVLKELCLETFSFRIDKFVSTLPEAEGVFNKRKKQIIEEIEAQKLNLNPGDIKVYGYEEDYGTVYTIMEFSSNANLEKYLQFMPKDAKHLPSLAELVRKENQSVNYFFFVKIFLLLGILLIIAFYGYQYFQENSLDVSLKKLEESATMSTPKLKERIANIKVLKEPIVNVEMIQKVEVNISIEKKDDIVIENELNKTIAELEVPLEAVEVIKEDENNSSIKIEVFEELKLDKNITKIRDVNLSIEADENKTIPINTSIKNFLDAYISSSSNSSVADTLTYYDTELKRYFKLRNISHKVIAKKQEQYNKKWVMRDFKIVDFEIMKTYKKDDNNLYDVKTITVWNVSNSRGKKASGESRGLMTLKEVENGFKIISIYSLK